MGRLSPVLALCFSFWLVGHPCIPQSRREGSEQPPASMRTPASLYAFRMGGKYGFVDATGRIRITPRFDDALPFGRNLAPVAMGGKWGFVDRRGLLVLKPRWDWAYWFSEGLAAVSLGGHRWGDYVKGGKWGYIDPSGRFVIPPRFEEAGEFCGGVAVVRTDEGQGVIDRRGNWVVPPPIITNSDHFSEGLLPFIKKDGAHYGYIDTQGRIHIEPRFAWAYDFSEGLACVRAASLDDAENRRDHGYIDRRGKWVIRPRFDLGRPFSEGLAAVNLGGVWEFLGPSGFYGGRWGYVDRSGKMAIRPRFRWAGEFSEGLAAVAVVDGENIRWGFIDKTGRFAIPPRFGDVRKGFRGGAAVVTLLEENRDVLIDRRGNVIFDPAAVPQTTRAIP